jgi:hypothetical protein
MSGGKERFPAARDKAPDAKTKRWKGVSELVVSDVFYAEIWGITGRWVLLYDHPTP